MVVIICSLAVVSRLPWKLLIDLSLLMLSVVLSALAVRTAACAIQD